MASRIAMRRRRKYSNSGTKCVLNAKMTKVALYWRKEEKVSSANRSLVEKLCRQTFYRGLSRDFLCYCNENWDAQWILSELSFHCSQALFNFLFVQSRRSWKALLMKQYFCLIERNKTEWIVNLFNLMLRCREENFAWGFKISSRLLFELFQWIEIRKLLELSLSQSWDLRFFC